MKENKLPLVSICIPLWERDEHFEKLIKSIKEHDAGIPYEICIGEGHNSASINRNKAMKKAKSNYICQLDGDAEIIQNGWLKKMYDTLISSSEIGIIGCVVEFPTGKVDHPGTVLINRRDIINKKIDMITANYDKKYLNEFLKNRIRGMAHVIEYDPNKDKIDGEVYSVFQCSGVCFLYDRRITGMFLEIFEKAGWEDVELFARVQSMGYQIMVNGGVRVKHPNHIRTEEEEMLRDPTSERGFNAKNLLEYMIKWGAL